MKKSIKSKSFLPLSLIFLILVSSVVRMGYIAIWPDKIINSDNFLIVFYLLWLSAEMVIVKENKMDNVSNDKHTKKLYAVSQALTILSSLLFVPIWSGPTTFHVVGILIFSSGAFLRIWSILSLGRFYSHYVRKTGKHRIINNGPYSVIRHPAYAGMILIHAGTTLYFFNVITVVIFLFLLMPAILLRIFVEEKVMLSVNGYRKYSEKKKRLIPRIW